MQTDTRPFWQQMLSPEPINPHRGPSHLLGNLQLAETLHERELLEILNSRTSVEFAAPPLCTVIKGKKWTSPQATGELLRTCIDEWLDSGRSTDGTDRPQQRSLPRHGRAELEAYTYSKGHLFLLTDEKGQLTLHLSRIDPGVPILGNPDYYANGLAGYLLVMFLLSPMSTTLAKCRADDCGEYFVLKQAKRPQPGGSLCEWHRRQRSQESALKATAADRATAANELHRLTAKRFAARIAKDQRWHTDIPFKRKIADYLNSEIEKSDALRAVYLSGGRKGVTVKWLALATNQKAINAIARGGKNAKG